MKKGYSFFYKNEIRDIKGYEKEYFNAPARIQKSNSTNERFEKGHGAHGRDIFYLGDPLYELYENRKIGLCVGTYNQDNTIVEAKYYLLHTEEEKEAYIREEIPQDHQTLIQAHY